MGDSGRRIDKVATATTADADATYGTPEANLINELKARLNELIQKLQDCGLMEK